ncbi:hypothetical protein PybrP1_008325 [[Pythium] brassicae (nom. inval.)]|nr:hypothetical protein PybrP1_008325 [[Pythium] brassicae (nom. inval.)]
MSDTSESLLISAHPQLSRLSRTTRYALALNQIERVAVRSSGRRAADGTALFAVDVFVRQCLSGIPDTRRSADFFGDERHPTLSRRLERLDNTSNSADSGSLDKDQKHSLSHYEVEYRYSAFRRLRGELRAAVEANKSQVHVKWCSYCASIEWLCTFESFPSRHPIVRLLSRCARKEQVEQRVLETLFRRRRKLERFLAAVLQSAKDVSYRFQSTQSECYARVSGVVADFLAERSQSPSPSCTSRFGW